MCENVKQFARKTQQSPSNFPNALVCVQESELSFLSCTGGKKSRVVFTFRFPKFPSFLFLSQGPQFFSFFAGTRYVSGHFHKYAGVVVPLPSTSCALTTWPPSTQGKTNGISPLHLFTQVPQKRRRQRSSNYPRQYQCDASIGDLTPLTADGSVSEVVRDAPEVQPAVIDELSFTVDLVYTTRELTKIIERQFRGDGRHLCVCVCAHMSAQFLLTINFYCLDSLFLT